MSAPPSEDSPVKKFFVRRWITIVLVVVAVSFIAQNRQTVQIHLFWVYIGSPLWLWLAILFQLGLIAGAAVFQRRAKAKLKKAGQQV